MEGVKLCRQFLAAFLIYLCTINLGSVAAPSKIQAVSYLRKYGYIDSSTSGGSLVGEETVSNAVKDFQRFAGLSTTGNLDDATLNMMEKPRCGVRDKSGSTASKRKKRYAIQGSRWHMNNLNYRISKYPRKIRDRALVDNEIARALQAWSDVTNIKFFNNEKEDVTHVDIRFEHGDHGDGSPFEGRGHTLAHAFFPHCGSDAHFDDDEEWTINEDNGTNLFQVVVHEIGHSLGLDHSDVEDSVMTPFYEGYVPQKTLDRDDIESVQILYGRPNRAPPVINRNPARLTPDPNGPNICKNPTLDAATIVDDGRAFFFKGDYYWEIQESGIVNGPRKISDDWDGMPGNIDAAMTWSNGKTYFFKNDMYYRFKNQDMDSGFPKPMHVEFPGIPSNVNAAFVWGGNGRLYFFKDDLYWRFDNCKNPPVVTSTNTRNPYFYPIHIHNWKGLPTHIDAALTWDNQKTYFFKGDEYYRFNDGANVVDARSPTKRYWLHCQEE
ncbi:hypothetical protein JTE90_027453 [Oedothorax gibbosus]|uniref:Peptidase metallopeptidase domain-containing protein n=1 Tax=Oedothorax gibbosus TaxID=931172 RepID=A0AAV6W349_9ARAC|nr:hypothetical protein JTE90_027453 [Oedothorax gibbosus]